MAHEIPAAVPTKAELVAQAEELGRRVAMIPVVAATMEVYGNYDEALEKADFYLSHAEHRAIFAASNTAA